MTIEKVRYIYDSYEDAMRFIELFYFRKQVDDYYKTELKKFFEEVGSKKHGKKRIIRFEWVSKLHQLINDRTLYNKTKLQHMIILEETIPKKYIDRIENSIFI